MTRAARSLPYALSRSGGVRSPPLCVRSAQRWGSNPPKQMLTYALFTRFLTATSLKYAIELAFSSAAGTRLALHSKVIKSFNFYPLMGIKILKFGLLFSVEINEEHPQTRDIAIVVSMFLLLLCAASIVTFGGKSQTSMPLGFLLIL